MNSSASKEPINNPLKKGYFLGYQSAWLNDDSRFKILEKSRRIGGTYMQSFEDVRDLIQKKDLPKVFFSSADLTAAAEYIDYCAKWAGVFNAAAKNVGLELLDEDKDIKTYTLELPGIGKKIHALSSNPKAFRSKGGKLILDEFAWHDDAEKMWAAARPIVTWGYPVRILSTHAGVNSRFNRFIKDIEKGKLKWGHHKVTLERAVGDGLADKILRRTLTAEERAAWIADERAAVGDENTWLQEYCCIPTDENSAFLTYPMLFAVEREGLHKNLGDVQGDLFVGFDVARRGHGSVIYVLEQLGHLLFERYRVNLAKLTFKEQKAILFPLLAHPKMRRACIDETGLGMQIAEEAQQEFGRFKVECINFSGASVKSDLAYGLYTDIEDKLLYLEPDEVARESIHSVRKITTTGGNIRFDAAATEKSGHGDYFWALALARNAARSGKGGDPQVMSESAGGEDSEDMRAFMQAFSGYRRETVQSY
jgi:phage FluMu gp28-like protein